MDKPRIADTKPKQVQLEAGDHYWCSCGLSNNQPFCDGSHAGTKFSPTAFTVDEPEEAHLCMCKHTANAPYCDGAHASLTVDEKQPTSPPPTTDAGMPSPRNTEQEPTVELIHALATDGLSKTGHHGPMDSMGVPRPTLPQWDDIQILTAQLATKPLFDDDEVGTELVIGPNAKKPLRLEIPLLVSDMSFGALSEEAKIAMARGAELAGTGICSGEGGMLPEEQAENSRYFYELASAKFGFAEDRLTNVQAFHFKGGQGAKTGTAGTFPATRSKERSRRSGSYRKEWRLYLRQHSLISPPPMTSVNSPTASVRSLAAFQLVSSCRLNISKKTSTSRLSPERITSSSTDEAAVPELLR